MFGRHTKFSTNSMLGLPTSSSQFLNRIDVGTGLPCVFWTEAVQRYMQPFLQYQNCQVQWCRAQTLLASSGVHVPNRRKLNSECHPIENNAWDMSEKLDGLWIITSICKTMVCKSECLPTYVHVLQRPVGLRKLFPKFSQNCYPFFSSKSTQQLDGDWACTKHKTVTFIGRMH